MRTYKDAKTMANSLRDSLAATSISLSHSACLEIVAQQFGFAEWNILSSKLDIEAGSLDRPQDANISLQPAIPALRVLSIEQARPFYVEFLGFAVDWGYDEGATYAQISRSEVTLHLHTDSRFNTGSAVFIRMKGLDALHRELERKSGDFSLTDINFTPFDSRVFAVTDPFGNGLRFWENNPTGIASGV